MLDELTDAMMFESLPVSRQQELIGEYCGEMFGRIKESENIEAAQSMIDEQCAAFDQQCGSALLRTAVRSRAQQMLLERWSSH